jgi:hypothetical protein
MELPFTRHQFLEVFAAYNESLWPFVIVLWIATFVSVFGLMRNLVGARFIVVLLITHWIWNALAYHAAFFTKINRAAWIFAGLFLIEAALLVWHGVLNARLEFARRRPSRQFISWILLVYALAYPALVWADGHRPPQMPTFGVPCPTTILTIGFFLSAKDPLPRVLTFIPILWAFIGGSAAFLLGVHADLALLTSGLVLLVEICRPLSHESHHVDRT